MIGRYRKKPVEIEAVQFTRENSEEVAEWCDATGYDRYTFGKFVTKVLEIHTLEGTMEAVEGDWIICGVKGEFYPCKPDIFEATYEAVT